HAQVDPARLEGELPELGEQHRLAGAAGTGDEDRPRLGDASGQRCGELVDRDVAAGEDHRGEAEPRGEGVAVRRHEAIMACVLVYVKQGRAEHASRLMDPPLSENTPTLPMNAARSTR